MLGGEIMKLKELFTVIKPNVTVIVHCNETNALGSKEWFLSCLDSRDLLAQVIEVDTNEYGFIIVTIDLVNFRF